MMFLFVYFIIVLYCSPVNVYLLQFRIYGVLWFYVIEYHKILFVACEYENPARDKGWKV